MEVISNVIWSPEIVLDIEEVLDYLQSNWPASVTSNFLATIAEKIDLLQSGIISGRPSTLDASVHSVFITKQNRLYYEVVSNELHLLRLLDTRQNPLKNPFE